MTQRYIFMEFHSEFDPTKTEGGLMQVISRYENQGLVICKDIIGTVLSIREDHVRLAISSPHDIPSYWEQDLYLESPDEPVELELSSSRFN